MEQKDPVTLFGLNINNVRLEQASVDLVSAAVNNQRRCVFFINAHCVNVAAAQEDYRRSLDSADLLYADGVGMNWAVRLSGQSLVDNVNGTDLFPILCRDAADHGVSIAFLGASPGIAGRCAERMCERIPGLRVVWTHDGYFEEGDSAGLISEINQSGASLLLVGMGVPKQEIWISRYAESLTVPVLVGVGALFDFYSGQIRRAPYFMRKCGFEWLYRLFLEPKRMFRRYLVGNPIFVFRAVQESLRRMIAKN